jgi:hypothetical protein
MATMGEMVRGVKTLREEFLPESTPADPLETAKSAIGMAKDIAQMLRPETPQAAAAMEALQGRDIYDGACTLKIQFSRNEQINVRANNTMQFDWTNPSLPREEGRGLGAVSGVLNTFALGPRWRDNLAGLLRFPVECCLRGRVPGVNAGSPWQQAATIVLAPAREELYALRETAPGFPALDAEALAAAVRRGLGGGGGGATVKARRGSAAGARA